MCSFIPSATDGGTYGHWYYLGHPRDPMLNHSAIEIATNSISGSDAETFPRQEPALLDQGWINSWPPGIPAHTHDYQINTESTFIYTDDGTSTLLLKNPTTSTHDGEFHVDRPSEITDCAAFTHFSLSTLRRSESFGRAPVAFNECHEGVSVTSDQSSYICADTTAYLSGSWSFSEISCTPPVVQHQEQKVSRVKTQNFTRTGKGLATESSWTSRRPVGIRGAPKGINSCTFLGCGKKYKLLSGLRRHHQDEHCAPNLCVHCGVFKWSRPYRLRDHLEKQHSDIDQNAALVEAMRIRRRATI
ncbi:hypothetical protein BJV74DRAFT_135836 [Russula compacta]|nr:hypothetical protein BJV74DRAFT_135836 [Russula compacta]